MVLRGSELFCSLSLGHLAMYEDWCKAFDPEQHKGEISELLVNVSEIRALYAKLVCTSSGASIKSSPYAIEFIFK